MRLKAPNVVRRGDPSHRHKFKFLKLERSLQLQNTQKVTSSGSITDVTVPSFTQRSLRYEKFIFKKSVA